VTGDRAVVTVQETKFYEGGLFNSRQYTTTFEVTLVRDAALGEWKMVSSDSYWAWCWGDTGGCR
jgi:hypothetical protein